MVSRARLRAIREQLEARAEAAAAMPDVSQLGELLDSNEGCRTYCDGTSTTTVLRGGTAIRLVGICCYTSGKTGVEPIHHTNHTERNPS